MQQRDNGTICVTQREMINKIIAMAKMKKCSPNETPALTTALVSGAEGKPWDWRHCDCARAFRTLLCASNVTRPDITFALSQVAQCTACPEELHARAVLRVISCLAGTADKGLVAKCDRTFNPKAQTDADFAGMFGQARVKWKRKFSEAEMQMCRDF